MSCILLGSWCVTIMAIDKSQTRQGLVGAVVDECSLPIPESRMVAHSETEGTATIMAVDAKKEALSCT